MGFDNPNSPIGQLSSAVRGMASGIETDIKSIDSPQGQKPKRKSPTATFLGTDATPGPASSNFAGKTLLGT